MADVGTDVNDCVASLDVFAAEMNLSVLRPIGILDRRGNNAIGIRFEQRIFTDFSG